MTKEKFKEVEQRHFSLMSNSQKIFDFHKKQLEALPKQDKEDIIEYIEHLNTNLKSYFERIELMQKEYEALLELYLSNK